MVTYWAGCVIQVKNKIKLLRVKAAIEIPGGAWGSANELRRSIALLRMTALFLDGFAAEEIDEFDD